MNTPTKHDDVIDSRDIIARIEELQSERDSLQEDLDGASECLAGFETDHPEASPDDLRRESFTMDVQEASKALAEWDEENAEELKELTDLASEGEDYSSDWKYGETLIRDSYFRDYAQELAEELDLVKPDVSWPYTCIDWERAERELQYDYSLISFGDVDYWIRSC